MKEALKSKTISTTIGFVFLYAFLSVLSGSTQDAATLLFFSIICTFGIGIIFWITLSYLIGRIISWVWLKYIYHDISVPTRYTPDIQSIAAYIIDAKKYGFKDDAITKILIEKGWTENQIKLAHELS